MICIFYCLIWFLVRFMWLTVGYHILCHIFGLDSFTVKNIHAVKKCFNGPEACFGLSAIHWWLGGGRTLRLVHWSGSEFSGKKNFVPELCGKLANWDLMHYRWVPNTSSLASPVDEHGWLVVTSDIMEPSSQWTRFVFAC